MNTTKTVIAAGIALALMGSYAEAAKKKDDEDKYKDVVVYGKITLDKDSAKEWGPWEQFLQDNPPAAGPAPVVPVAATDFQDPIPVIRQPEVPQETYSCGPGDWCGYTASESGRYSYGYEYEEGSDDPRVAGRIALTMSPDDPELVTVDGGEGPGMLRVRRGTLDNTLLYDHTFHNEDTASEYNYMYYGYNDDFCCNEGLAVNEAYHSRSQGDEGSSSYAYDGIEGGRYIESRYVTMGNYVNGSGQQTYNEGFYEGSEEYTQGWHVAGLATPAEDLDMLRDVEGMGGNVIASYLGTTTGQHGDHYHDSYRVPVEITVNFGTGNWEGSWNGGADGGVHTHTNSGVQEVFGQVGFYAEGTLTPGGFTSTSVGASDAIGNVTGNVQGMFYGPEAEALGGVSDITKTTESYDNGHYVDVFAADKVEQVIQPVGDLPQ